MAGKVSSMEDFLNQCKQSGDAAYSALRSLLERLEDPNTRKEARIFLTDLQKRFSKNETSEKYLQTYHVHIQDIYIEPFEGIRFSCPVYDLFRLLVLKYI